MSELAYCCPYCAVMPPPGVTFTQPQLAGAFQPVRLWQGRRSGRFWLHRPIGCTHRPDLNGPHEDGAKLVEDWNAWALQGANEVADKYAMDADRRKWWLYWLGHGEHPDFIPHEHTNQIGFGDQSAGE